MIAYCGLDCQTCPIHLATLQTDKAEQARLRAGIARLCKEHYGMELSPEDISDCDGCRTDAGRLFSQCKACPIRICAGGKQLVNCAYCAEYPCDKLEAFFRTDPAAKARLDAIRTGAGVQ